MRYSTLFRGAADLTRLFSSDNKNSTMDHATAKFLTPNFVPKQVNDYVLQVGFHESSVAEQLRLETAKHERSRMMGCPIEASMFKVLLPAIRVKKVIEGRLYRIHNFGHGRSYRTRWKGCCP